MKKPTKPKPLVVKGWVIVDEDRIVDEGVYPSKEKALIWAMTECGQRAVRGRATFEVDR